MHGPCAVLCHLGDGIKSVHSPGMFNVFNNFCASAIGHQGRRLRQATEFMWHFSQACPNPRWERRPVDFEEVAFGLSSS